MENIETVRMIKKRRTSPLGNIPSSSGQPKMAQLPKLTKLTDAKLPPVTTQRPVQTVRPEATTHQATHQTTPVAQQVVQPVVQPAPTPVAAPVVPPVAKTVTQAATEPVAEPIPTAATGTEVQLDKGLIVGLTDKGQIVFQNFGGKLNILETVGLLDYAGTKKAEILASICQTTAYRVEKKIDAFLKAE